MNTSMSRTICLLITAAPLLFGACAPKQQRSTAPKPEYITHTISYPGETLTLISSWYTGRSQNWRIIQDHNPGLNASRMRLGDTVRIPLAMVVRPQPFGRDYIETAWARKRGEGGLAAGTDPELVVVDPSMLETEAAPAAEQAEEIEQAAVETVAAETAAVELTAETATESPAPAEEAAQEKSRQELLQELLKEY